MGLLLQIIGVLCVITSLIWSICAIIAKGTTNISVVFLIVGLALIGIGRKLH